MGKTQSKRSVDITTDPKKGPEEEVTGKMEKIEDVDQKEVNGDATIPEKNEAEKKDAEECENDKDLTTEKSTGDAAKGGGDSAEQNSNAAAAASTTTTNEGESPKDDGAADKEGAAAEEISPLADDSIKKTKKDKVKKKWSFRSISFGKKDKQKPAKSEETAEVTAAAANTNGEEEKTPAESDAAEASKNEEGAAAGDADSKPTENGETKTELNGEKTPIDVKSNETAVNDTTTTTTTETTPAVSNETANDNQTETNAAVDATTAATPADVVSNGNVDDAAKNGVANDIDEAAVNKAPESAVESNNSIPNVEEKPHQNGTNGDDNEADDEQQQLKSIKSQIEVNTITTNTITTTMNIVDASAENLVLTQKNNFITEPTITTTITTNTNTPSNENSSSSNSIIPEIQTIASIEAENVQNKVEIVDTTTTTIPVITTTTTTTTSTATTIEKDINEITSIPSTSTITNIDIAAGNSAEVVVTSVSNAEVIPTSSSTANSDDEKQVIKEEQIASETQQQTENQLPPPLPISPPPSQVSVFAFKNTEAIGAEGDVSADTEMVLETNEEVIDSETKAKNEIIATEGTITIPTIESVAENDVVVDMNKDSVNTEKVEPMEAEIQTTAAKPETEQPKVMDPVPVVEPQVPTTVESELSLSNDQEITNIIEQEGPTDVQSTNQLPSGNDIIEKTSPIDLELVRKDEIIEVNNVDITAEITEQIVSEVPSPTTQTDQETVVLIEQNMVEEIKNEPSTDITSLEASLEITVNESECNKEVIIAQAIVDEITEKAEELLQEIEQQIENEKSEVNVMETKQNELKLELNQPENQELLLEEMQVTKTNVENEKNSIETEVNKEKVPCEGEESIKTVETIDLKNEISLEAETIAAVSNTSGNSNENEDQSALKTSPLINTTTTPSTTNIHIELDISPTPIGVGTKDDVDDDVNSKTNEAEIQETGNETTLPTSAIVEEISKEIEQKLSLNIDDQSVEDEKEINPKDLKENAVAEITTQDLPVTCE